MIAGEFNHLQIHATYLPHLRSSSDTPTATFCNVPGCNNKFPSVAEFESHYNSLHRFNCAQCRKNLPSAHLLDLHLEENHDSYFEMLAKKKASFRCFLEVCQERFWLPAERRDHGITVHKLPSNFRYATNEKKFAPAVEKMEDDQGTDEKISVDPQSVKKSTIIKQKPITFGHNVPKSFDTSYAKALTKHEKKKSKKATPLEDNQMMVDLLTSLPQ